MEGERWRWKKMTFGHLYILPSLMDGHLRAGTFLVQICWDLPCCSPAMQASFLPHHWAEIWLMRKPCQGKAQHTVLKNPIFSPQGQSREANSVCPCHLYGKASLLPLVCSCWVGKGLAQCFSLSPMVPMGRPRTVGLQLRLSWGSTGWARKEPGHSCNRR